MHPMLNIAAQAAREASKTILKSLDYLKDLTIEEKGHHDFVSEVDKKAEQIIIDTLKKHYPDHGIIAEESGRQANDNTRQWIIDPLDGTANYLQGIPFFSVSIAFMENGKLTHGLVYDPVHQEMFSASHGQGAKLNGKRIRVNDKRKLEQSIIGTGFPFRDPDLSSDYLKTFKSLFTQSQDLRRLGSAALDLAYVACGRFDGYWEFHLNSWDIAAGALIVQEAGGIVCDFDGAESYLDSGNIAAANPKLLKPLLKSIHHSLKT